MSEIEPDEFWISCSLQYVDFGPVRRFEEFLEAAGLAESEVDEWSRFVWADDLSDSSLAIGTAVNPLTGERKPEAGPGMAQEGYASYLWLAGDDEDEVLAAFEALQEAIHSCKGEFKSLQTESGKEISSLDFDEYEIIHS